MRGVSSLLAVAAAAALSLGVSSASFPGPAQARPLADPVVGDWEFHGPGHVVVRVSGSGTSFVGKIVSRGEVQRGDCPLAVGDVIWKITGKAVVPRVGTSLGPFEVYTGTISWIPNCGGSPSFSPPRDASWRFRKSSGETVLDVYWVVPGHAITDDGGWGGSNLLDRVSSPSPAPKPATPKPKPKPKPKPAPKPQADAGWLELAVALKPANAPGNPLFRVCLKKADGTLTLCFNVRQGRPQLVENHGKRIEWPIGARVRVCVDPRLGWVTPGCQVVTIGRGLIRKTIVSRVDVTPPKVTAYAYHGYARPGEKIALRLRVTDDSRLARVHNTIYQGGQPIGGGKSPFITAKGELTPWVTVVDSGHVGALYFCLWAEDGAGNRSATDNHLNEFSGDRGSCAWIPLVVPIEKVSNTCGGEGWAAFVAVQNYFGNEHTYRNSNVNPLAQSYTVSFADACNLHDAGYGGYAVEDKINGGIVDYRGWSRPRVDRKFLADMRKLCARVQVVNGVSYGIRPEAKVALKNCKARGGNVSIGAEYLYNLVAKIGWRFFDADLTKPGPQKIGHRPNFD